MFQFPHKIVASLSLFAVGVLAYGPSGDAQEHFIGEGQAVNRVIKLRSHATEKPVQKPVVNETSRGDRVARTTNPVANPSQIQFDEIDVPRALQDQLSPLVEGSSGRTTVQPAFQSTAPAVTKLMSKADDVATEKEPGTEAPQVSVSTRNNTVSTEIKTPKFVNVNQTAQMEIHLRNEGQDTVDNVKLVATLPDHAEFVSATPQPSNVDGRNYEFEVARLDGERTQKVILIVVPKNKQPLEIGTQILLENSQRTLIGVQQPELTLKIEGPKHATIGETVTHELVISNVGDGVAHDIRLDGLFPAEMRQTKKSGTIVIPTILPGRTLRIPYETLALTPGQGELKMSVLTQTTELQTTALGINIYQPELRLSAVGPKLNFVERDGIYTINIDNTGEVDVTDVNVSLSVPDGMKVTTISRQAAVDAEEGTLIWMFDNLPAKSSEQIQLKATALKEGQQVCSIVIKSNETLEKEIMLATQVTARANLSVRIKNQTGPVQVGARAEFQIEVENYGSRQANDIDVRIELPESLMPVKNGQDVAEQYENALLFKEPQIAPGEKVTFSFAAVGVNKGEHVVRSTLEAAGSKHKVISEDSVYVYDVDEARVSEELSPVVPR